MKFKLKINKKSDFELFYFAQIIGRSSFNMLVHFLLHQFIYNDTVILQKGNLFNNLPVNPVLENDTKKYFQIQISMPDSDELDEFIEKVGIDNLPFFMKSLIRANYSEYLTRLFLYKNTIDGNTKKNIKKNIKKKIKTVNTPKKLQIKQDVIKKPDLKEDNYQKEKDFSSYETPNKTDIQEQEEKEIYTKENEYHETSTSEVEEIENNDNILINNNTQSLMNLFGNLKIT